MAVAFQAPTVDRPGSSARWRFARLTPSRLIAFLCGAPAFIPLSMTGQLFLGELILPLLAGAMLLTSAGRRLPRQKMFYKFLLVLLISLSGYVLADLVNNTKPTDFLRGWARLVFLGVDFLGLTMLGERDPAGLWWYSLGVGLGSLVISLSLGKALADWKFGYAASAALILLCALSFVSRRQAAAILVAFAALNMTLDYRSLAGVVALVGVILWARSGWRPVFGRISLARATVALAGAVALFGFLYVKSSAMQAARRAASDEIRYANARTALESVVDTPILGHGSWATNRHLETAFRIAYFSLSGKPPDPGTRFALPHSQILCAWFEGGLLGAVFFLYFGQQLIVGIRYCASLGPYDYITPMYLFLLIFSVWHLLFSPFGGDHRLQIALSVAILCTLGRERSLLLHDRITHARDQIR